MVYFHRLRRRYRRYGRGNIRGSLRYTPINFYTHRYRNSGALCSTAGFYDSTEVVKNVCETDPTSEGVNYVCKDNKIREYRNDTEEFQCFSDYKAPITKNAAGAPYFQGSDELDTLLARYSKYKLKSVKIFVKNFRFLQVTVRCKDASVSADDRLKIQKYLIAKYGGDMNDVQFKNFYVPYDKFEIVYQYVPSMFIDRVYRNHTVFNDSGIIADDIPYGAGDAPTRTVKLTANSVLKQTYYPKVKCYLDSNDFFSNKYSNGNFKKWLDAMQVTNYPNLSFVRLQLGPDQYIDSDVNTMHLNVMFYDYYYYYRFKFAGINNLDVQ